MSDMLAMAYLIEHASKTNRRPHEFEHLLARKSLFKRLGNLLLRTLSRVLRRSEPTRTSVCNPENRSTVTG